MQNEKAMIELQKEFQELNQRFSSTFHDKEI